MALASRAALNLHVYPAEMRFEGRIFQNAGYLLERGLFAAVELAGIGGASLPAGESLPNGVSIRRFRLVAKGGPFSGFGWTLWCAQILLHYTPKRIACINAHSVLVLPLCWLLSAIKRCPLIYEPQELETEINASLLRKLIERLFVRRADRITVPNPHTGRWYEKAYGLERVWVIRNIPAAVARQPVPAGYFAARFGFAPEDLVFLYQGQIEKNRCVELLVDAFEHAPHDRHIVFLGYGPMVGFVQDAAERRANVHWHPPVLPHELVSYAAAADVGVMMVADRSLHDRFCYPGKYCQYLSAGKPVLVSAFMRLRDEVESYDCGWPAPLDAEALASLVGGIGRSDIARKAKGAREWAACNNWMNERKIIDQVYTGLSETAAVLRA